VSAADLTTTQARRALLRFLLQSPLLGTAGAGLLGAGGALARPELALPENAGDALDVFQLEAVARRKLDRPAWHFIVSSADDGRTMQANRDAYAAWQLRVRRLVDVTRVEAGTELFGQSLDTPLFLSPVGSQQSIHAEGELATARAARAAGHLMIASTATNFSVGEIGKVAGPLWFQLYASPDRRLTTKLIRDAEAAGCTALALTVDSPTRGNREAERWWSKPGRSTGVGTAAPLRLGNFEGYQGPPRIGDPSLTWDFVDWLRGQTRMKLLLKGIVTREDAALAEQRGVDGIIVSNHGGRQEESGRGTLECLPEVVEAVGGRMPVLLDGGIRRGTDILKALALGARAVGIGRPYLWGLGAFGEEGVARVLVILREELKRDLQLTGVTSLRGLSPAYLQRRQ
jgi:4-hydroxymandelate oxidase